MDVVLGTSEVCNNLHFPIGKVLLHEDREASITTADNSAGFGVGHKGDGLQVQSEFFFLECSCWERRAHNLLKVTSRTRGEGNCSILCSTVGRLIY